MPSHYIAEHEAPSKVNSQSGSGSLNQSPEEQSAVNLVNKLFQKAKAYRMRYDERWLDYYKIFRGKQWRENRPKYRHSEVINFIFQTIQSVVPILTDKLPKVSFLPVEPQDLELSTILEQVKDHDWETNNWLMQLSEILYDSHFYGIGYGSLLYDSKMNKGFGGLRFESVDPLYCYPDPEARNINDRCRFFIHAEPVDVETLKKEFPNKKDYIRSDMTDLMYGDKTDLQKVRFKSPVDNKTVLEGSSAFTMGEKNQVLKITCYLEDDESIEESDKEVRKKYPAGRKIVIANNILLQDGELEYEDARWPFIRMQNYILPREFYGISEVEQLESPQNTFNKLVSFVLDVLTLMGNPIWVVDESAGIDTDNLVNQPGLIIEKNPGSEVRRESGVQLQPFVLQMIDRMENWFNNISGATDITRGVKPEGVRAGVALEILQDASQTRLRLKSRIMDAFLQEMGQMYISRVFQFYTAPRIFRLTNNQAVSKYFKMSVEPIGDKSRVSIQHLDYSVDGKQVVSGQSEFETSRIFDVRATTGSSLPFSKLERFNSALTLFDRGIIDEKEVLTAIDYPNKEAVLLRLEQRKQAAAEAAMQQEALNVQPRP